MGKKQPTRAKIVVPAGGWQKQTTKIIPEEASGPSASPAKRILNGWHPGGEDLYAGRPLVWSFSNIDDEGPFRLRDASIEEFRTILDKLRDVGRMTCGELEANQRRLFKKYPIRALESVAQDRLRALKLDDETHVSRIGFSGKERFYGIQRSNVFYVLWWDPNHEVCKSKKRG